MVIGVKYKFHGTGVDVASLPGDVYRGSSHLSTQCWCECYRRTLFDNLLMATLNRAFAFTEMNKIAKSISKYLNLNVTRLLKQAFEKDGAISKGGKRFASCAS